MKPLTLTQLRKAIQDCQPVINEILARKKMDSATAGAFGFAIMSDLRVSEIFLMGESDVMPRDPREVLTNLEYEW